MERPKLQMVRFIQYRGMESVELYLHISVRSDDTNRRMNFSTPE
jgi:hypothetical protein